MSNAKVRLLPNGRAVTWDLSWIDDRYTLIIGKDEVRTIRVDLGHWLDSGETVDDVELQCQSSVTLEATTGDTTVDLAVSGVTSCGRVSLLVLTSNDNAKRIELGFRIPSMIPVPDIYRCVGSWGW